MGRRKSANRDLPPRMLRRLRKRKNGTVWMTYVYDGRDADGKRIEIPLGSDLDVAKREWAKLDCKPVPVCVKTLDQVFDRYEREILPGKKPSTQRENLLALKQLRGAFGDAPVNAVTPQIIAQYRDKRTAKIRANRELSLLSHVYNVAREWGLFDGNNPVTGVRKNKERPRDFYAGPLIWDAVYAMASSELRDAMDLAYLTGQRPADVLKTRTTDVVDGFLQMAQGKTAKKLRIRLSIDSEPNQLGVLVARLLEQHRSRRLRGPYLVTTETGLPLTGTMLRRRFNDARQKAMAIALENRDQELCQSIQNFQFRDIRPKAASEIDDLGHASRLLGHTDKRITETVYRRVGEIVKPTR
ncbi:integrase [Pseudomonas sp. v388]|uniref:phage integrase n=1 Tax=Pseudomonas sp. v388 TaxID=2479849 RepID=UPI000F774A49|nr:tyrosine-type recombinase/integrase [Pseudomonas sp. v388]RRV04417.1 integrase [Pseudomonas sp. v388]